MVKLQDNVGLVAEVMSLYMLVHRLLVMQVLHMMPEDYAGFFIVPIQISELNHQVSAALATLQLHYLSTISKMVRIY